MGMTGRASFSYDVFLSFYWEDTRHGFTGYLYNALSQREINCFIDDKELRKGEEITRGLVEAIKESKIAIIVLSEKYAFSSFCLQELTTILECFNENKVQVVLPVFYKVDPSDVRKGTGSYGEALIAQKNKFKDDEEKVNRWREALLQAANLVGFHFEDRLYEYQFIEKIVREVSSKIGRRIHATNYPVGLTPRVDKVISRLKLESNKGVLMVGICGYGGIGKTTIAREVFNSISDHFDGSCFLEDIREDSRKHGLVHLQKKVLSDILRNKDIELRNVNDGKSTIKQRLCRKKVLLVLDDVDQQDQLQKIVGEHDWFGVGSRVIITTRDIGLLKIHGDISKYEVELFNNEEARELLCWNAFKTNKVDPKYNEILNRAVRYASGLPLALEVIGSDLRGKEKEECELILAQYGRISEKKIQNILKVSFDSLDSEEQKIFLDIACCFGGYKLSDVEDILHAHHGSSMKPSIDLLIEKSLIKIEDGLVTLHGLIQDMGREIVQEEASEPGKRSRLWSYEDVVQLLQENKGTSKIQILVLDFPKDEVHSKGPECERVHWNGEAIKKMKNLRTLIIRNGCFSIGPKYLPNSLRVLKWSRYPSQSLPCCFNPKKLSLLELPKSHLKSCQQIQKYTYLRVLDFGYSEFVTEIPDVTGVPNLEKLSFKHCENLTKIHDSVGYLGNLKILDAVSCKNLKTFPPIILISLEQLNLSRCSSLESFPEILGKMENIKELHIAETPINELSSSIQNLTQLRKLELQLCGMVQLPSSIVMLPELALMHVSKCRSLQLSKQDKDEGMVSMSSNTQCLILSCCNISDEFFPMGLTWFANVKDLNLSGNSFKILDECIKECHNLMNLKLDNCVHLEEIRGIPRVLETFSAKGCTSLRSLDLSVLPVCTSECLSLKELILDDCVYLHEIKGVLPNLDYFSAKNCTSLTSGCTSMFMNQESVEAGNKMFSLPGTKIPEWFKCSTRGDSILFWFRRKFPAISLCIVIGPMDEGRITVKFSPRVFINRNEQSLASRKVYEFSIATDHIFLFDIQLLKFEDDVHMVCSEKEWNRVEVSYADHMTDNEDQIGRVAKHSGIYVFKGTSPEDIQFSDPYDRKRKSPWEPKKQLTEKHRLMDMRVSETQYTQNEQHRTLLTLHVEHSEGHESMEGADEITNKSKKRRKDQNMVQTISCGTNSGEASLRSIREAINELELLTVKDLSEVSSESAMHSRLDRLLVLLSKSSHPEVKEAIVEFKTKASATVESVNKLKNFEKHRARIQRETVARMAGKGKRIDPKDSKKKKGFWGHKGRE